MPKPQMPAPRRFEGSPWFWLALLLCILIRLGGGPGAVAQETAKLPTEAPKLPTEATPGTEQERYFEQKIRPLLAERCWSCHGATKQESGLRLDSWSGLTRGGASGEALFGGGVAEKMLFVRAIRREGDYAMPPETPLSAEEVGLLSEWVARGAPFPKATSERPALSPVEQLEETRRTHWSFQPIARGKLPPARDLAWAESTVDRLILARLEGAGLVPSPHADRRTLIRRLAFDLLGLPPSPESVDAFLADEREDAWDRLVDRLLSSPHYGERWGRHWLDVARYADTKGYAFAQERRYPYAYTYRDYVVSAWNADLPFDRFIMEQLAADLLPLGEDRRPLAALGFLTTGRKFNNRNDDLDDQIDLVGRGLLGLTVSCARCHEHKFDPIPTEDYYSLYGVFASSREPEALPEIGPAADPVAYAKYEQQLSELQQQREKYRQETHRAIIEQSREHVADYLVRAISSESEESLLKLPYLALKKGELRSKIVERWKRFLESRVKPDDPVFGIWHALAGVAPGEFTAAVSRVLAQRATPTSESGLAPVNPLVLAALTAQPIETREQLAFAYGRAVAEAYRLSKTAAAELTADQRQLVELLTVSGTPTDIADKDAMEYFNRAERERYRDLGKKIDSLQVSSPGAPPRAMVLAEDQQPHDPRVLIRGNPGRPGQGVPRQFLAVVAGPQRQPFKQGSGRLELAQAIVAESNPLTRRVVANRIWMYHFGEPLVSTPADFGLRCERPPQQDVLDYLAGQLGERSWSLKELHREILLGQVYRQASHDRPEAVRIDPENRLYWKMNRRRLEFEAFRDALLAVSGRLDGAIGGRPVEITVPAERRRSVYAFIDRQDLPGLFRVFDFPSPDQSNERRPRTTVPQQALFGMNSPLTIEFAKGLASRTEMAGATEPAERSRVLFKLVFGREPSPAEQELAVNFVSAAAQATEPAAKLGPWEQLAQTLLLMNEFAFVD